ncbi:MAG: hypothetical protein NWE98_10135 [Candidatus Bathyarchaeota archaeon]|nr:hypothetical protein [Candidatus Bathyarchaeota archaeon]
MSEETEIKIKASREDAEKFKKMMEDAKQRGNEVLSEVERLKSENEELKGDLTILAEREFNKRKDALAREGYDVSKVDSPEALMALESVSKKYRKESWEGTTAPLNDRQFGIEQGEGFETIEEGLIVLQKQAKTNPEINRALSRTMKKALKNGFDYEYEGSIKAFRKPIPDRDAKESLEHYNQRLLNAKLAQKWRRRD